MLDGFHSVVFSLEENKWKVVVCKRSLRGLGKVPFEALEVLAPLGSENFVVPGINLGKK